MSAAPFRINDRRSSSGYINSGSNNLIESATQTQDRKRAPMLDLDIHRTVSSMGRRVLMTLGRQMFWRFPALQGSILEQANLAVSSFIPQYTGRNREWGDQAEALLIEWHKIMDIAGWPYDFDSFVQGKVIDPIVDGENFTLLTQSADGYPMIQIIPAHRVGSSYGNSTAKVRFTGKQMLIDDVPVDDNRPYPAESEIEFEAAIVDGVITDAYGRALAYRVCNDSTGSREYQDISARNMFPAFVPMATGQVRGFSLLASSVFDWQDMSEWKRFELLAQKAFSSQTLIEMNETGDTNSAKEILSGGAFNEAGKKTQMEQQTLDGGTIRYFRAGTGSKLEAFQYDRPGAQSQAYLKNTLRDAFKGTEWDVFFSLDPQAVGGAPMRVIVERINSVLVKRRKLVKKCCVRTDGYALSKFMQSGLLPWDDDWFKWEYQGPGDITADRKYDSDVDIQEVNQGYSTKRRSIAKRGGHYDDVRKDRKQEVSDEISDALELVDFHKGKITFDQAITLLRPPTPNQQLPQPQQATAEPSNVE